MRETRTINEWMDQVAAWQNTCEHSAADTACAVCVGALHPVLAATARHLEQQLGHNNRTINAGDALRLAMDTDALCTEIHERIRHLLEMEAVSPTPQAATNERVDIGIIANNLQQLLSHFERRIPDIRSHHVSTGVRQGITNEIS